MGSQERDSQERDSQEAVRAAWGEDEFVGGALALDFTNTFNERPEGEDPEDRLVAYPDLTRWAVAAGALTPADRATLDALAARHPDTAAQVLAQAHRLRRSLLHLFAGHDEAAPADLAEVERQAQQARAQQTLGRGDGGIGWTWPEPGAIAGPETALARPLWPVVLSALDILTDATARALTRQCAGPTCTWVFLDTTKNHRRRWCDMATCGNRAKAHRHYTRRREPASR